MAFGPDMKPLVDEATALCGIACYADVMFPADFRCALQHGWQLRFDLLSLSRPFRRTCTAARKLVRHQSARPVCVVVWRDWIAVIARRRRLLVQK